MKHGELTAYLGRKLAQKYPRGGRIFALDDHGKTDNPAVGAIRLNLRGFPFDNRSVLADIDIMIAEGNKAIILIEIEETTANPKQVIGDVFAPFFAEHVRFKSTEEYKIKETCLIIGLLTAPSGSTAIKTERLSKAIKEFQHYLNKISFPLGINEIYFVCRAEGEEIVKDIEQLVETLLKKNSKMPLHGTEFISKEAKRKKQEARGAAEI